MKRDFIVNFVLILATVFVVVFAARLDMWFSATGAFLLLFYVVYRQFSLFDRYKEMLLAQRDAQRQACNDSAAAEAELLFYKVLMDGVDTAVMLVTKSGYVEWMNGAAKSIVGGGDILPEEIIKAVASRRHEVSFRGEEYSVSCSRVAMRNSCRNIIAMKNIHSAVEKSKVDAWHKLVRVLTHEIMNSMAPIISLSETLCASVGNETFGSDGDSVDNLRRGLEIISRRSSGLLSFVENYRKLTHIAVPDKKEFSVAAFINDIKEFIPQSFIEFDAKSVSNVHIYADRSQLEQLFINVLKNAIEACEEREKVAGPMEYGKQIICSVEKCVADNGIEHVVFIVRDNGIGILGSVHEQIFVPFFTTKKHGSGIGLSLCKQIVVNHGGSIEILSGEDCGCTVVCRLPVS